MFDLIKRTNFSLLLVVALAATSSMQAIEKHQSFTEMILPSSSGADSKIGQQATPDQQRALLMLDSLFDATDDLQSDITKVYLQVRIADTLWKYDEPRARRRFRSALVTVDSIKAKPNSLPNEDVVLRSQLRADVLKGIEQNDPKWAKELVLNYLGNTKQSNSDIWIIMVLVDIDPQYATQLMKRKIDGNNDAWLDRFLEKLRRIDTILADDLFIYALSLAERRSSESFDDFRGLFRYVFPSENDNYTGFNLSSATSPVKPELIRHFLDFGYKILMQRANLIEQESKKDKEISERSGLGYMEVQILLPFFDKYLPDRAAKIRARWDGVILNLRGGNEHIRQVKLLFGPMSTQDMLHNAEQAKNQREKQALYIRAARQASTEGNLEQAFLILQRVRDKGDHSDLYQKLCVQAAEAAIAKGNIDTAYRYARGVEDLLEHTDLLGRIVQLLQDKKDFQRAMEVLNDALEFTKKAESNWLKPRAMLKIACAATLLNPNRGFEVMNLVVEVINSTKDYAQNAGDFDQNLLLLARIDFDRTMLLTQKLNNKESLLIAQTAVYQGILAQK